MLLAIDVGNTHTVFALCDGQQVRAMWRFATTPHRTEDEYASTLLFLMGQHGFTKEQVSGCIISSVVPDVLFPLKQCALRYFGQTPLIVGHDTAPPDMKVRIDNPHELGADRLVNAYAAWSQHRMPLIVVDFGTATTFDVVDSAGDYVGGLIAPGVNLSLEALRQAAAKLPSVPIRRPQKVIGTHTVAAMQSGLYFGYLGLVEGIISRIKAEKGPAKVIATGGLSSLFAGGTDMIDEADEQLTIRGLQLMYGRSASR